MTDPTFTHHVIYVICAVIFGGVCGWFLMEAYRKWKLERDRQQVYSERSAAQAAEKES